MGYKYEVKLKSSDTLCKSFTSKVAEYKYVGMTHIEDLLSHRWRVRRTLIGQQSFGNCTAGCRLVILIKRTETEKKTSKSETLI